MIATKSIEEHIIILKSVFHKLAINQLSLRVDKCYFLRKKIKYLRYIVKENEISPYPDNLIAIENFPIPENVRDVQCFIELGQYFRKFVKDFSLIAKPLYDLIRKDEKF